MSQVSACGAPARLLVRLPTRCPCGGYERWTIPLTIGFASNANTNYFDESLFTTLFKKVINFFKQLVVLLILVFCNTTNAFELFLISQVTYRISVIIRKNSVHRIKISVSHSIVRRAIYIKILDHGKTYDVNFIVSTVVDPSCIGRIVSFKKVELFFIDTIEGGLK